MSTPMTSLQRVLTALGHVEPDRVPYFLPVTMHGAAEVGMSLRDYFLSASAVAEGQMRLRAKYRDDVVYPFFYGAVEHEAFGGDVAFYDDGPPNAVGRTIESLDDIRTLVAPEIADSPPLMRVLEAITELRDRVAGEALIVGVVMSPFSLPVMQMGFDAYLALLHEHPAEADHLHRVNEEFTVRWANAQLSAGAHAIGYFDPVSSPTIVPQPVFRRFGLPVMQRTLPRIEGPAAALLASGLSIPLIDDLSTTTAVIVGASSDEDLADAKAAAGSRITVMGNLNGIAMRTWTPAEAEEAVKRAIARAGTGGGFILSDTHGEIPIQVPEDVLLAISAAVEEWGRYPLTWVADEP